MCVLWLFVKSPIYCFKPVCLTGWVHFLWIVCGKNLNRQSYLKHFTMNFLTRITNSSSDQQQHWLLNLTGKPVDPVLRTVVCWKWPVKVVGGKHSKLMFQIQHLRSRNPIPPPHGYFIMGFIWIILVLSILIWVVDTYLQDCPNLMQSSFDCISLKYKEKR